MLKTARSHFILFSICFLGLSGIVTSAGANGTPESAITDEDVPNRPLRELIRIMESETGYRMLYRDALVAGKRTRYQLDSQWETSFLNMIRSLGLDAKISHTRKQIVIFQPVTGSHSLPDNGFGPDAKARTDSLIKLEGYVMDGRSGERLPFATIIWEQTSIWEQASQTELQGRQTEMRGTQTDLQGRFDAELRSCCDVKFQISYVGYESRTVTVTSDELRELSELPFRLAPSFFKGKEIVITGPVFHNPADSVYKGMLSIGKFSPAGENNSIRMLQTLPSVTHGTALSEGLFIRGSQPDAHQVLLDGMVIYNQSHLFGLIDSFNADAIRTSNFFYDVTPARYQAPPGGTLNLVTRTGSLHEYRGHAGLSSSTISAGIEGPLVKERASWLLSGRTSVLNMANWLNTDRMVAWGLDIDRDNSLAEQEDAFEDHIITPGDYQVRFHDVHTRIFWERSPENRWSIGGYSGYNHTLQHADRLVATHSRGAGRHDLEEESFETANHWGNYSININNFRSLTSNLSLQARGGFSHYQSRYMKEDFTYQRPGGNTQTQLLRVHPFEHESILTHGQVAADFQYHSTPPWIRSLRFGAAVHGYRSRYEELSLNRSQFAFQSDPLLIESYIESRFHFDKSDDGNYGSFYRGPIASLEVGNRMQYFSNGGFLRASPRLQLTFFPNAPLSAGLGYSRTYQYLYKLSFYNLTTSDIWITASKEQKPTSSDHWSTGIYLRPGSRTLIQAEAYLKRQQNLRFHEINIQSMQAPLTGSPWFHEQQGLARGLELLFRYRRGFVEFTQTYTLSYTKLRHELLNEGNWFYAYWDRRHQYNTMATLQMMPGLSVHLNWLYTTGAPDRMDLYQVDKSRLGFYSRVDLSFKYSIPSGSHNWEVQAGAYNLLDRKNPWYNDWILTLDENARQNRLTPVQADIYDLGFQPSFSVRYLFDP